MTTPFSNSLRSLELDSHRGGAVLLAAVTLLLSAWLSWFLFATVGLYEVSRSARVEVAAAPHTVETPKAGRVVARHLEVGELVDAGDLLIVLEAEGQELRLQEERARIAALGPQLDRLRHEIAAEVHAWTEASEAAALAFREAQPEAKEAAAVDRLAHEEARRVAEASTHETRIERLGRLVAGLEGELSMAVTVVQRLEREVEAYAIRSPVAGVIGEIAELEVGAFIEEGERICSVVPAGDLMVHAEFRAAQAVARIHPGQSARLKFDGFPWSRFGTVPASVVRVAGEARDGLIRVELAIDRYSGSSIPLTHGLPTTAEIEIDRASPASLLLRRVGSLASQPQSRRSLVEAES